MDYSPIPVAMLQLGKPLPVDVWDPSGKLLLRKGQPVLSEQHRQMLSAHHACMAEHDARAWQKAYERMIRRMLREGVAVDVIANAPMPSVIADTDYVVAVQMQGGWLDLQEVLRGLLYQGASAINPLERLDGIEKKVFSLLQADPDESLFILFQALADASLGYCSTHALLTAVVGDLTAQKLEVSEFDRSVLLRAALTMNIGMAREQDSLTRQRATLHDAQRQLIEEHPQRSLEILQSIGVLDEDQKDIVRWHHDPDESLGLARNIGSRRILRVADRFVARMAARKTRRAMSPFGAVKAIYLDAVAPPAAPGAAMATAVGFYPPGTYVELANGEKAVAVARGLRAHNPLVVSLVGATDLPLTKYVCRDTADPRFAINAPLNAELIKVRVNLEKVKKARQNSLE